MIFRFILTVLSFYQAAEACLYAGWIASPHTTLERATIQYSADRDKGYATIDGALKELASADRIDKLDGISAFDLMKEETFQEELFSILERDAPRELKEALHSAGNMHNPKMYDLAEPFRKAALITPTFKTINSALAVYGMTVSELGTEKLQFHTSKAGRRFFGILWLKVTKLPNQALQRTLRSCHSPCFRMDSAISASSLSLRSLGPERHV